MWVRITDYQMPPQQVILKTKLDDGFGERNVQDLIRKGNLWFIPDGSMYVYYTPTHYWKD